MADENMGGLHYEVDLEIAGMVSGAQRVNSSLDDISKTAGQTSKQLSTLDTQMTTTARAVNDASKSAGGFKSQFQQAGYQIQDFIVQVQGGQSALVAFSQQGSQLAGAFGPGGAIVGAFIALGSVLTGVLMSALGNTGNEMDKLSKAADALNKVVTINSQGVAALSNDYARLAVTNATLAAQLRDNAIANYEIAVRDAGKAIQGIVKDQSSWFSSLQGGSASVVALGEVLGTLNIKTDSFRDAFAEASKTGLGVNNMASTLTATVSMLTGQFDIGDDAAFGLAKRLNDLAKNPSPQALSSLIDYMNTLTPTTKAGADALTELETKLLSAGAAMQEAQDRSEALKKQLAELKTEAQNANFDNISKQLETQRIALTQGQQAAKEYAISQQDLTDAQKSQLITASRQVGQLEQEKKARDEAAAAAKRQASSAASAAASVAQKLQQLQEKAALSASSTKELSREQAILQAQQSLGKSATQDQINLAGQYAATAYDNAAALKAQTEAEKKRTQAQQNYTKLQGQANPISGLDNQYASDMQQLNEYATMYPQKIAEIEATRAGIEQKYRQQRIDAMYNEWAQQNAYTTAAAAAFDSFGQTAGNALTGVITGSMTLSEALRSIGSNILSSVINAFVQMGVEWLKSYIVGTAGMTASVAAGTAGAATLAAAWAPAAALASLATGGANAIPAQAGIVATAGVAQGLSVAGMRKNGGPVAAGSMYRVGEGGMPEIYQASNGNQYMIPGDNGSVISNKDINGGSGAAQVSVYNYVTNNSSSAYASSTATSDENGNITIQTIVQDIEQGGEIGQAIGRNFNTSRRATE
ncbi:phage tail protein [Leclercia sp.]|uniref:phage tail protein n=1 Tax=Leclercia sp. TaxID=1898428 RepID=UPI0028AD08A1|nr:phage tail protein [Leclercia sp.]